MKTAKILVHDPVIELDCAHALASALKPTFKVQMLTTVTLTDQNLEDCDLLAIGGGIGDSDLYSTVLNTYHKRTIDKFIFSGGKYLGICMGAYWADSLYLGITNLKVRQYITSPGSEILTDGPTSALVNWLDETHIMYFYDGCTYYNTTTNTQVFAKYQNGMPMAVIDGSVGLVGCHPEAENWWFDKYDHRHNELVHNFALALLYN